MQNNINDMNKVSTQLPHRESLRERVERLDQFAPASQPIQP